MWIHWMAIAEKMHTTNRIKKFEFMKILKWHKIYFIQIQLPQGPYSP